MGKNRFLATYLASGAFGNYVSSLFSPNPSVGASGAIFGLVGAYYTFLKTNEVGILGALLFTIAP
jgi:rhomboid protease GluP